MSEIKIGELPEEALLYQYKQVGAFTDCYFMDIQHPITSSEYIEAFYTTPLFKLERAILSLFAAKPSSDLQAKQLALGQTAKFSAWRVEQRTENQLLLCDFTRRTRSWLMCSPQAETNTTRLYFGSAVVPKNISPSGEGSFGFLFHALSGFHRLYTRALMRSALSALSNTNLTMRSG
jgi:hypothetical protein